MLHYNGTTWTSAYVSANDSMKGIWGTGPTNVWTVGKSGTIANYNGSTWSTNTFLPASGACCYNAVWGTGSNNIVAVGQGGLVATYNGTTWTVSGTRIATGNLTSVWGTGSTYFAVADDGTAYMSTNSGATWGAAMTFTPANANGLTGVFGTSASNVWNTGAAGTVYEYTTGPGWAHPSPANGTATAFQGTWLTSATDVYAVGAAGAVQHFNGSVWLPMAPPVTSLLLSIYGTAAQNVYVAGDVGVVVLGTGP
jgi:hypothetical protein